MTCGDHSDPEVGTWVMDDPLESLGDLSLRAFDKIVKVPSALKLKQETLPHKFKIRGSGDTLPETWRP